MSSVLDSLMGLIESGRRKDGAATARANLEQTWDYPSLVASLPYRYYDEKNELFINTGTAGFVLELAPLPGANEQVMAALDDMLRKKLPRKTPVTVVLTASKCVGERIARGVSTDKPYFGRLLEVPVSDVGREYQTGVRTAAGYQQPLHSHSDVFIRRAVPDRTGYWVLGAHGHDGCDPRARGDGQHGGI